MPPMPDRSPFFLPDPEAIAAAHASLCAVTRGRVHSSEVPEDKIPEPIKLRPESGKPPSAEEGRSFPDDLPPLPFAHMKKVNAVLLFSIELATQGRVRMLKGKK